jgi:hypothetical protein
VRILEERQDLTEAMRVRLFSANAAALYGLAAAKARTTA